MRYSEIIRKRRKDEHMTLQEFGDTLGVTKQCVFNWENGTTKPNDEQKKSLHEKFDIGYDIFFDD